MAVLRVNDLKKRCKCKNNIENIKINKIKKPMILDIYNNSK